MNKISSKQNKLLNLHLDLVLNANINTNITSINNRNEAKVLHIEDSLIAFDFINNCENGDIIDLGSGAGYPGIPLAITSNRKVFLTETVTKKAILLNMFINELKLYKQVKVYNDRIENISRQNGHRFKIVTARALSSIPSLLELSSPLIAKDGYLLCYKGVNVKEEIDRAEKIYDKLGFCYWKTLNKRLSNGFIRNIVIYKKCKESVIKLPRKLGFAQKKPLS